MAEISLDEITESSLEGAGVFDELMSTIELRLDEQYKKNRIKGSDYATVYLGAMQTAMQQSIQFVLSKQQSDKQAELLVEQIAASQAQTAINQTQSSKDIEVKNEQITASILDRSIKQSQSAKDLAVKDQQITASQAEVTIKQSQSAKDLLVKQEQIDSSQSKTTRDDSQSTAIISKLAAEENLLVQKKYSEEAQILDTVNENNVSGVLGKQKNLYQAQINGFSRDAEQKVLKIMMDSWSVRRSTIDSEIPPTNADNTKLDQFISKVAEGIDLTLT